MQLPYEDEAHAFIREALSPELALADQVFSLAINLYAGKVPMTPGSGLDDDVIVTVLGLLAKACKQFRGIVLLAERGLDEVASSNCRMLFETMVATIFLMRKRVTLLENGKKVLVHGKPLTTRFRTKMYRANDAFHHRKFQKGVEELDGRDTLPPELSVRRHSILPFSDN